MNSYFTEPCTADKVICSICKQFNVNCHKINGKSCSKVLKFPVHTSVIVLIHELALTHQRCDLLTLPCHSLHSESTEAESIVNIGWLSSHQVMHHTSLFLSFVRYQQASVEYAQLNHDANEPGDHSVQDEHSDETDNTADTA